MKPNTRGRAMRVIVSSLLDSNLALAEVADLGKAFLGDRTFSEELGRLLISVADTMRHQARYGSLDEGDIDCDWLDKAQKLVKRRRLPKQEILDTLHVLYPQDAAMFRQGQMPVNEILKLLASSSPVSVRTEFMKWLEGSSGGGDPYLEGIMKRK